MKPVIILASLSLAAFLIWFFLFNPPEQNAEPPQPSPLANHPLSNDSSSNAPPPFLSQLNEIREDRSEGVLADYHKTGTTTVRDLELVRFALEAFNTTLKHEGSIPMSENREVMLLLFGNNPFKLRFVDPTLPHFNDKGEILDSWGTPLFFHFSSSTDPGLRSAGPDQKFWTKDDITYGEYSEVLK